MRLIDANALELDVQNLWMQNEISNGDWVGFREMLNSQETIVEFDGDINKVMVKGIEYFPQKTGKWIVHTEIENVYGGIYIECSECGESYVVQHLDAEIFCRTCGSKNGV